MDWRIELLFALLASTLYVSHGCSMDGINTWLVPHTTEVIDIQRGIFFERNTTNIQAISSTQHSEELSGGPYVSASLQDDVFTIFTNDAFAQYEENEVATSIGVTFVFTCAQGSPQNSVTFVVQINVIDTNNNAPQFLPSNAYELTVTPPLPPGYLITGCLTDIIVRDIDLTTRRIEFAIEDNPYFEIEFDEVNTIAQSKEFKAILRTTSLVRNIPEPLQLVISATDVDDTRDPPLTTNATVRIQSDGEFELPEEPVFSQAFYLAEYSNNQIIQQETISLQQGYHDEVVFDLEGELAANFEISRNGSELTLVVTSPLSADTLSAGQLYMAVKAQREYTSGASATIIIQLPQVVGLEFEQANYEGTIVDNALTPLQLVLSQGYEDGVTIAISSEFASYFTYTAQNNAIILNMSPLESTIIDQNNFINLLIIASNDQSTATTIVTLDIIKDDNTTPAFEQSAYTGSYDTVTGLYMEQNVTLAQGYDGTVGFYLDGEHSSFFELDNDGPVVSLRSSTLPTEILSEGSLLLTVLATKPRTVGANTVVSITLPAARNLIFDSPVYSGIIQDNVITMDTIILGVGYGDDVEFTLSGDYADYFEIPNTGNEGTLSLSQDTELPADVILSNKYIPLIVSATGQHALETSTTIILDILKDDTSTPVFRQNIYTGTYTGSNIDLEAIDLLQGYDGSVTFRLDGLHSQYFGMNINGNGVEIAVTSTIPTELIMEQKVLSFSVLADKPLTVGAHATVIVRFPPELSEPAVLRFSQNSYVGSLENNLLELGNITLETGYSNGTLFSITGEYSDNFEISENGNILTLQLTNPIPNDFIEANSFLLLDIEASYPGAISGYTTIVLDIVNEPQVLTPVFAEAYYIGEYSEQDGLLFDQSIELIEGFDDSVTFGLDGDDAQLFQLVTNGPNNMSITANNIIADTEDRTPFILSIIANKPNSLGGKATIIISRSDLRATRLLSFSQNFYAGRIEDGELTSETIILSEGYTPELNYALSGEYADHFQLTRDNASFELALQSELPTETVSSYNVLVLTLEVGVRNSVVHTSIVIELIKNEPSVLSFDETFYIGSYSEAEGLVSPTITLIEGFDENVSFFLHEESAQWFDMDIDSNTVSLVLRDSVPPASLLSIQPHVFSITAEKPGSATTATIVISVEHDSDVNVLLSFERNSYLGYIENDVLSLDPITLIEGYNANVSFSLQGDLSSYFTYTNQGSTVTVSLQNAIPEESIPTSGIIVLELQASAPQTASAYATIVFEVVRESATAVNVVFSETYYTGQYTDSGGLVFENLISLAEGYDESVQFTLEGESAQWFEIDRTDNEVSLVVATPIPPEVPTNYHQLIFTIAAQRPPSAAGASATIIIFLRDDETVPVVVFDKVLYEGIIQSGSVHHEAITVSGFTGTTVEVLGAYGELFEASHSDGVVVVNGVGSLNLGDNTTFVPLELRAGGAGSVLILDVMQTESSEPPSVVFSSASYSLQVDTSHTGLLGRVEATASNGESVSYSLQIDNEHLLQRLFINNEGEIHLSAPAQAAEYSFQVTASTVFTQASGAASVQLTVDGEATCTDDSLAVDPLIVLDRDEEEPHRNLIVLREEFGGCRYSVSSSWPEDQSWLYVDDTGLHTNAIDREDQSIAFMALSQVKVELLLHCDTDTRRNKRSVDTRLEWLGPYDYGNNTWVIANTIEYNPRRTVVNLIVNDINDNYPIFVGKENEPITVGYPISELEERVLPRVLIELRATDADVGENAALRYWSSDDVIAVSPSSGLVHVRHNQRLENNAIITVHATDRNGEGLTGSLDLLVKLLDVSHIAVVTVKNAFLDDEQTILDNLSAAVGYEINVLRSTVISDNEDSNQARRKRNTADTEGASMQMYVYGLIENEPVEVDRVTTDINNLAVATVVVASSVSLEDHLNALEICNTTGLLVATIVLSVLLFILIVVAVVWFFLKWWKNRKYDQFSDANSLASQNETSQQPKPQPGPQPFPPHKPRLNIEELRRSERRLQEMLDAPIEEVSVEPSTSREAPAESVIDIPQPSLQIPIVIQSIDKLKDAADESDDEDEFGERLKTRRKSVVTFNENVEKIIHVEDPPEEGSLPDYEVYKL